MAVSVISSEMHYFLQAAYVRKAEANLQALLWYSFILSFLISAYLSYNCQNQNF